MTPHFSRNVPHGGVPQVPPVFFLGRVAVDGGSVAVAHGFGLQVPGPMSTPPLFRHACPVFAWHIVVPIPTAWQHRIIAVATVEAAEPGRAPVARRRVHAKTP